MDEITDSDAAVQIVEDEHYDTDDERGHARRVVAALARAGWLHAPAEVAALRAVADAARTLSSRVVVEELGFDEDDAVRHALDALPARRP